MFGHSDNQDDQHKEEQAEHLIPEPAIDGVLEGNNPPTASQPAEDFNPALPPSDLPAPSAPASDDTPASSDDKPDDLLPAPGDNTNDLLDIKTQALKELSPLVGHLDQSPEEKFRTTMMMIQASDNQALIQTAYEAAKSISDEKTRAQALLDIVNEINYFTHQQDQN